MSIPVPVRELSDAVERYGDRAFLLTTSDDERPHVTHVQVSLEGSSVSCPLGRTSARNGRARPKVSLLWHPVEPGGYSLIADGDITVVEGDSEELGTVAISGAVLHRPAPGAAGTDTCEADCITVEV
jgi:hypothetical protein